MSSSQPPPPPPRRTVPAAPKPVSPLREGSSKMGWRESLKAKGSSWGKVAMEKGIKISDNVGGKINNVSEKASRLAMGSERFYPVTGDFPQEMEKCARIIRAFTVDGLEVSVPASKTSSPSLSAPGTPDKGKGKHVNAKGKKQRKVLRKIPPTIFAQAQGLVIFTSMRSGMAPFGGAGGAGVVVARLPDGSWSPPSAISPNNLSTGLMLGVDIYDAILIIRDAAIMQNFTMVKPTIGMDVGMAAGPFGAGAAMEAGKEKSPVLTYVRTRGLYAGVQVVGQVFVERFEENGMMYNWPGVKAAEILAGKVRMPREAASLMEALADAESGKAQAMKGDGLDVDPESGAVITGLASNQKELELVADLEGMTLQLDEHGNWVPSNPNSPEMHEDKSATVSSIPAYSEFSTTGASAHAPSAYPDEKSSASFAALGYPEHEVPSHGETGLPSYDHAAGMAAPPEKGGVEDGQMTETERRELQQHIEMLQEEAERDELEGLGRSPQSTGKDERASHIL